MTRYNYIKQHIHADTGVWSISEPDRWERVKLQYTYQGIVLESDYVHLDEAKATKKGMERMMHEIIMAEANKRIIIRRKAG